MQRVSTFMGRNNTDDETFMIENKRYYGRIWYALSSPGWYSLWWRDSLLAAFLMRDEIQGLYLSGFGPYAHDDDIWFEPWPHSSCVLYLMEPGLYTRRLEPIWPVVPSRIIIKPPQSSRRKRDQEHAIINLLWALEPWIPIVMELSDDTKKPGAV